MRRAIKGLLIKEFKLMKINLRFFIIIMIVWGALMASQFGGTFIVGYTAMLFSFLTVTTFSYDEFENGAVYLFTLPVLRRDYIREKYLFGFLISTLPTILASMMLWIADSVWGEAEHPGVYLLSVVVSLPVAYLILALEIPLLVRFGSEKSRLISVSMLGCTSIGYGILHELTGVDSTEAVSSIAALGTWVLILLAVAALVVLVMISYKISCRFMEKKEF